MSGYLGRVATQLAGGGVAPKPTVRTSSPIASHDQLPMVDGLEAAPPPAFVDVQSFDAPAEASVAMPVSPVLTRGIEDDRDRRDAPRTTRSPDIEEDRVPTRARDEVRAERGVADDNAPSRVAVPSSSRAVPGLRTPPSVDTSVSRLPPSALDLMQVLGRVSQDIANANRAVAQPEPVRVQQDTEPQPRETRSAGRTLPTPTPFREPAVVAPTPITPDTTAAPQVQIGELRIEVVEDAPRTSTRCSTRHAQPSPAPGRGPIGSRPSKRRFAAGRG